MPLPAKVAERKASDSTHRRDEGTFGGGIGTGGAGGLSRSRTLLEDDAAGPVDVIR